MLHYSDVTSTPWCLHSQATQLCVQQFIQNNIKANRSSLSLTLCGEQQVTGGFSSRRDNNVEDRMCLIPT